MSATDVNVGRGAFNLCDPNDVQENDSWVKLVSSDGYAFLVKRSVAMMSGTLKNMLNFDSQI